MQNWNQCSCRFTTTKQENLKNNLLLLCSVILRCISLSPSVVNRELSVEAKLSIYRSALRSPTVASCGRKNEIMNASGGNEPPPKECILRERAMRSIIWE